jgi:DNA-binding CsgD family transcriptional regulator
MVPRAIVEILDAAAVAETWLDYEQPLLGALDRTIGFDLAFCVRKAGFGPHSPGFDAGVRRATADRIHDYGCELAPMRRDALRRQGVAIDVEFFGRTALQRTRTYRDMIAPHRGDSTLLVFMGTPETGEATVVLGRTRSSFKDSDLQTLAAARSLLVVCERAVASRVSGEPPVALTPRERELLGYLRLGYTNRDIALACGTSFRTVRNQMSKLFAKLEVATRAEAVARSFELGLPRA